MTKSITFACLGDSLTAGSPGFSGYGTWRGNIQSQYEFWLEQLIIQNHPEIETDIVNFGVGGNVVWQMQYRFNRDVLSLMAPNPDYVILMGGINDLLGKNTDPEMVGQDLAELYDLIHQSGAKLIAMEIAPCTVTSAWVKRIQITNQLIHQNASKQNAIIVPIYQALVDKDNRTLKPEYDVGDGVHFSVAGYKKIGKTIYQSIFPILKN